MVNRICNTEFLVLNIFVSLFSSIPLWMIVDRSIEISG